MSPIPVSKLLGRPIFASTRIPLRSEPTLHALGDSRIVRSELDGAVAEQTTASTVVVVRDSLEERPQRDP